MYLKEESLFLEKSLYGVASPPSGFGAGHFTQVVWKKSKELG